jgi:hypothetical protein
MSYNLSGCVFIRNTFEGAFCLFESMHQLLPLCDEFIVMDLGSDDGTLKVLRDIEKANPKITVVEGKFHYYDAAVFATLANDLIAMCNYPNVLYYQADEIWHEDLVELTRKALNEGKQDLSFWRYQLKYNFQEMKQFPQVVHRIGPKDNFNFVGDGMNSDRHFDPEMTGNWGKEHFMQWGDKYKFNPVALPTGEMILDVSLNGAFLDNIPDRRRMHLPFWHEGEVMPMDNGEILSIDAWVKLHNSKPEWGLHSTKFNIPKIMEYHLGRPKYTLRPKLLRVLKVL